MKKIIVLLFLILFVGNAEAQFFYFREKPSRIHQWMNAKGYSGSTYDMSYAYFQSLSGLSEGTLYDHLVKVLGDLGYTGTIRDQLSSFFQEKTGVSGHREAESAFWADSNLDFNLQSFDPGDGLLLTDDSSFLLLVDNSSKLIFE
jgi:hypothetical protein